jgi:hypothetical protein
MSQTGASNPDGTDAIAAICANSQESTDSHSDHIFHRRHVERFVWLQAISSQLKAIHKLSIINFSFIRL